MKKWICRQKTFFDPEGGLRLRIYTPGEYIILPDDVTPPDHVWIAAEEYTPPEKAMPGDPRERPTVFGPSLPPVDEITKPRRGKGTVKT